MDIAPTLLIGVGGTGSKIIERIMKKMDGDHSKRIQCVVMDTDANELGDLVRRMPGIDAIQTSANLTVAEALNSNTNARLTWFPRNQILESKSLTEGAGQVRAISRLAYEACIETGKMTTLHRAVGKLQLLGAEQFQQGVRVVVVGTLAGGTGSGMFLPLSLYVRNYLTTECNVTGVNIRGFFLLPDIIANTVLRDNMDQQQNMRANAYAALRELDAFVARADGEDLSAYPAVELDGPIAGSSEREPYPPILPYDHVFLMDYMNANGKTLSTLDDYIQYAADTIHAFAISPMSTTSNSKEDNEIRRIANIADNGHCRYVGAGSAEICYPIERVAEYVSLNWAKDSIGEEWVRIDRENDKRAAQLRKEGEPFDEATEYVTSFEEKAASNEQNNRFFVGLMRQANGHVSSSQRAEVALRDISLFPSLEEFTKSLDVDQSFITTPDDTSIKNDDDDLVGDEENEQRESNSKFDPIILKDDASGQYIVALRQAALDALTRHEEYRLALADLLEKKEDMGIANYNQVYGSVSAYLKSFEHFRDVAAVSAPLVARSFATRAFSLVNPKEALIEADKTSFSYWLRKPGSKDATDIIHPSAVRYIAYKTYQAFESLSVDLDRYMNALDASIQNALSKNWSKVDGPQKNILEAVSEKLQVKVDEKGFIEGILTKGESTIDKPTVVNEVRTEIIIPIGALEGRLQLWSQMCVMKAVALEAIGFFRALNSSYREFYRYLEAEIPLIQRRIENIEDDKLLNSHSIEEDGRLGNSTRFVCADRKSLGKIMEQVVRTTMPDELEGAISAEIYIAVLSKAEHDRSDASVREQDEEHFTSFAERQRYMETRRSVRRAFFKTAYERSVLGFWQRKVVEDYAGIIDVDVIQAIYNEAKYNGILPADLDNYASSVLEGGWILSQIFLQQTNNPPSDRLKACLYDENIVDADDIRKKELLKELNDEGGKPSRGVGSNRILFYQACYGIAARDLDKFAVPRGVSPSDYLARNVASDGGKNGGVYYEAYSSLIRRLTDNLTQGSCISPHIDTRWHLAFQFPDIDVIEVQRQRYNVIRAFTYAIIFGKVKSSECTTGIKYMKRMAGSTTDLTVRDGICDSFYEVFEALVFNNRLVYDLLEDCTNSGKDSAKRDISESKLAENLRSEALGYAPKAEAITSPAYEYLLIDELIITHKSLPNITGISSIYDIPLFYEATLPARSGHGDFVEEMVEAMQEIVFNYICQFKQKSEAYGMAAEFYIEQFKRYIETRDMLKSQRNEIGHLETCQKLGDKLDYWFSLNRSNLEKKVFDKWRDVIAEDRRKSKQSN